jgi:protein-serine/threonine kinase
VAKQPPIRVGWTNVYPEYHTNFIRLARYFILFFFALFHQQGCSRRSADVVSELWGSKDTPPATPRGTTSTGSALNPAVSSTRAPSPTNPAVGPPKGKLIVKIIEAKDLIPSKDPYVVCTFESNEFISQGPRKPLDGVDGHGSDKNIRNGGHGHASSPSGLGRSIAIPMASRQSSSTSLSEMQGSKPLSNGTTNPKWDHNAVL